MKSTIRSFCAATALAAALGMTGGCDLQNEGVLDTLNRSTDQGIIVGQLHVHNGNECQRYLGIPYAKAPVGNLRFRPPRDPEPFEDESFEAFDYGPMCPQHVMGYISGSEDCLYLNVWAPADAGPGDGYPVMFFIHGGANMLGSGNQALSDFIGMAQEANALNGLNSFFDKLRKLTTLDEPIYQGNYLAANHRVVLVTINYRLGMLGHLAHPSLGHGSGNFAFMDIVKALEWVQANIDTFGGDRDNVTVFGESAGAWDTCALMNMPAARGLFHRAIMESQACLSRTLDQAEKDGVKYVEECGCDGADDIAACLRDADMKKFMKQRIRPIPFIPAVDGEGFPKHFSEAIATDQFNHVPLIIGNNQSELVLPLATDIGFNCPLDANLAIFARHLRAPLYQYRFVHHPLSDLIPVIHMFELPYVFGATRDIFGGSLKRETAVEEVVSAYWTAFARTGDPNSSGQACWPLYDRTEQRYLRLSASPREAGGSIIENRYNIPLSRAILPEIMGPMIVFW